MKSVRAKYFYSISILIFFLIAVMLASLCVGELKIPLKNIWKIFSEGSSMEYEVLTKLRMPRTLLGFAIGGSLSLCGVILQGIYRNPLVEPYTLGISGGASLGVTFAVVSGLSAIGFVSLPLMGFAGAFVTIFLVYLLSVKHGRIEINRMLLIGIMISFISSSLVMFLLSITSVENVHGVVFWTMGSLTESDMKIAVGTTILSLVSLFIVYLFTTALNALRLGESKAKHLGINIQISIRILFIVTSLVAGCCIATAGVIGFVGLIVPHAARLIVGNNYKILLAASFLLGSIFLIICDMLARTIIYPNELPIGVITGIFGGTAFLFILSSSKNKSRIG